jgi:uncharacterized protein YggT (Ycf19 family)
MNQTSKIVIWLLLAIFTFCVWYLAIHLTVTWAMSDYHPKQSLSEPNG